MLNLSKLCVEEQGEDVCYFYHGQPWIGGRTAATDTYWSFEEKTFVKQSLGTVLEILTKLLCFAHAWLRYTLGMGGSKA